MTKPKWGILFRPASLWVGAHWSSKNKRMCVNLIPTLTFWITWGISPTYGVDVYRSDGARYSIDGMLLNKDGSRSIFDDVDK